MKLNSIARAYCPKIKAADYTGQPLLINML